MDRVAKMQHMANGSSTLMDNNESHFKTHLTISGIIDGDVEEAVTSNN